MAITAGLVAQGAASAGVQGSADYGFPDLILSNMSVWINLMDVLIEAGELFQRCIIGPNLESRVESVKEREDGRLAKLLPLKVRITYFSKRITSHPGRSCR